MRKAYTYIRFSTPEQLKGNSLRRQLEAGPNQYAAKMGMTISDTTFRDLGLSAFHSKHATDGDVQPIF